jgi:hypothetical protein
MLGCRMHNRNTNCVGRRYARLAQRAPAGGAAAAIAPPAASYSQLCAFAALPSASSSHLQLCDLDDPEVRSTLAGPPAALPAADDAAGWLPLAAWEGIKARVARRFQDLLDALPAPAPMEVDAPAPAAAAAAASAAAGAVAAAAAAAAGDAAAEAGGVAVPEGLLAQLQTFLTLLPPGERAALGGGGGGEGARRRDEEEQDDEEDEEEGSDEDEDEDEDDD